MSQEPTYTPSVELREITARIRALESIIHTGFAGNDDWRAKQSYNLQLDTLVQKLHAVEEKDRKQHEIAVLDWKLGEIERQREETRREEMQKEWEENPIFGLEI